MTREAQIREAQRLLHNLQPWARLSSDSRLMAQLAAERAPVRATRIYRAIAQSLVPR